MANRYTRIFDAGGSSRHKKGPEKQFFTIVFTLFSNIWPLARPSIAGREAALVEKAKLSSHDQVSC